MPRSSGVVAAALSASRLLTGPEADAGLRLLRLDQAAIAVAVLGSHLGGQRCRMSVADLHELIDEDLLCLREAGMDLGERTTARTYCDRWRAEGILVRSTAPGEREESYELSAPAEAALRYLAQVERPRPAATQSRLASIASQLDRLVRDSDPSTERRLAGLRAERDAIDAQIARVETGQAEPLDPHDGAERLKEIIALAEQIPGDLARVRSEMTDLNRSLRERIVEAPGSRGEVLDDVFRGVDRIESSEAGRSFLGFFELLQDPESSALLDDHIDEALSRGFAEMLDEADRRFLRDWRSTLVTEAGGVRQTMTGFSRSLRAFVASRAFEEHRRLSDELARACALAGRVAERAAPIAPMGMSLELTGLPLASVGSWRLNNPADAEVAEDIVTHSASGLDLDSMRQAVRASEIDMIELAEAVADSMARRGAATLGDILADHPATQGLASVIGLLLIGRRAGALACGEEEISWSTAGGEERRATIPRLVLTAPVAGPSTDSAALAPRPEGDDE
ncbi:DUF3375 domain-containing protein [Actinomyces marmotae]|uniref:DUF3375 domain-containing protein n=1 Tax=Actinomyces marmotae TaxID=2737173 RepID=UPI001356B868|nr:DUF3375 domain-containing protein [Actinomyces marmotae]